MRQDNTIYKMAETAEQNINIAIFYILKPNQDRGARVFAYGAMGRRIDPSWGGPIELFLVPASVTQRA